MNAPAIEIENLSKLYRVGELGYTTLRESLGSLRARWSKREVTVKPAAGMDPVQAGPARNTFWALRNVSATVRRGEIVGVIGRNGAGKSTLLKILSRITEPTEGRAVLWGRVSSLLEIGAGFHPELSGRENIFLNGAILGMRKSEIIRQLDDIISFADVGAFIDTPVKRYSSGMYVRLAFAVAAHLDPDILIVDEVLAVGDVRFQKKCLGRMQHVSQAEGRTVLFVSHNIEAVQRLCGRCLLLDQGRVRLFADTPRVVAEYLSCNLPVAAPGTWIDMAGAAREGTGEARFSQVRFTSHHPEASGQPYSSGPVEFELTLDVGTRIRARSVAVSFYDDAGRLLVNADTGEFGTHLDLPEGRTTVRLRIEQLHLRPGIYSLGFWLARHAGDDVTGSDIIDFIEKALEVEVVAIHGHAHSPRFRWSGVVPCNFELLEVSQASGLRQTLEPMPC
jgi:lipopolysaccharide transport system ATP-binding protein